MTKPAWLNGLRHGEVPIFADIARIFRVRDGHRLAFDVRSKAFTRDSRVPISASDGVLADSHPAILIDDACTGCGDVRAPGCRHIHPFASHLVADTTRGRAPSVSQMAQLLCVIIQQITWS